jgi:uncharacterized RDD family membrane protein YckC
MGAAATAPPAGFWVRAAADLLDGAIITVAGAVLAGALAALGLEALGSLTGLVVAIAYLTGFHGGPRQATPGKRLFGIRLVRDDGLPVTYGLALLRHFGLVVSALPLGIGVLMAGLRADKRALHDMVCGTRVIHGRT